MADVDNPTTHVEDQDLKAPRKQPESPKHEGIDPLTESDTMYPRESVKEASEKGAKVDEKEAAKRADKGEATDENQAGADLVSDQEEREAKASTPNELLNDKKSSKK